MKRIIRRIMSVALAFALVLTPATKASAASRSDDVATINSKISSSEYQMQIKRYWTNGSPAYGQCNVCAITNLLNRKFALDGKYSSSNKFKFDYVFYETCMYLDKNNLTVDKAKAEAAAYPFNSSSGQIYSDYDSDGYLHSPIYELDGKKYNLVKYTGSFTEKNLADLIDAHHEGIFVRFKYGTGGHCVVLYNYSKSSDGKYTFYSIDTASSSYPVQGEFSKSYLGDKKYNNKTVSPANSECIHYVMYLTSASSSSKMSQSTFFGTGGSGTSVNFSVPSMGMLPVGKSHNLTGVITSSQPIATFTGQILKNNTAIQTHSYHPNQKQVKIESSPVNTNLRFASLGIGTYTLKYTIVTGGKTYVCKRDFTITTPTLTINMTSAPGQVNYGSSFNLVGTVSSMRNITKIVGQIKSGETVKQTQTITPNTPIVDIKSSKINANLKFGSLAKGSYKLVITATDSSGATKTYTKTFSVR